MEPYSGVATSPKIKPVSKPLKTLKTVSGPASGCAGPVLEGSRRYCARKLRMNGVPEFPIVVVSLNPKSKLRSPRLVRVDGRRVDSESGLVLLTCRFV